MADNINKKNTVLYCSFCGKSQRDVKKLIAGPNVFICNECVDLCHDIVKEEGEFKAEKSVENCLKPKDIKAVLDQYVIGQEEGKKIIAVAVYNHYKRISHKSMANIPSNLQDVSIAKSNILIVGPTGTGKTLIAQTIAKIVDVPFAISDATTLTEAGYIGEDVESIIGRLVQAAEYDIQKAQNGIVYVDEIDKISRKGEGPSVTRDVSGEGVQQALLKLMEGTVVSIPPAGGKKHPNQEMLQVDTSNILFIVGGAFADIDRIVAKRLSKNSSIGFGASVVNKDNMENFDIVHNIKDEDVIKYGLIPEFVGRLPVLVSLHDLNADHLEKVLTEPKNAIIAQYRKLFAVDGIQLTFTGESVSEIAKLAVAKKVGARGLRGIIENILQDIMYDAPSNCDISEIIIDKEVVTNHAQPKVIKKTESVKSGLSNNLSSKKQSISKKIDCKNDDKSSKNG